VPKPNYHHAKKQRELAKKTRKQEKEQRKSARSSAPEEAEAGATTETPAAPLETTTSGNET
jgi:hypothetical protein